MANNNPDLLYLRSRSDLLRYEDARFNSLIQAVADFYSTRNDQSIWGNFLRALAIELSKLDYDYNYDLVNKDPSLLTPPDIRRRWAAPLYISSNWPAPNQFDTQYKQMLVELIAAYKMGTTVQAIQDVIFAYTGIQINVVELYKQIGNGIFDQSDRNAISVSVQVGGAGSNPLNTVTSLVQLQTIIQSLYNAIALAKPAHVGLEFTTIFGEAEDLECILSPQIVSQQQFIQLPTVEQGFYQFTGYTQQNPAGFWRAATAFPLGSLLRDSFGNFQIVTSIGAFPNISGPGPAHPSWQPQNGNTTLDNDLTWTNISPNVVSTQITQDILTVHLQFPVPINVGTTVKLINLTNKTFLNNTSLVVTSVATTGLSFTANLIHADYALALEGGGTATFPLPANITTVQYNLLSISPHWQALYQQQYTNYCCASGTCAQTPQGMTDTLRIFVKQSESGPLGQMLIQAPVFDPKNPKTTIAAYGRLLAPKLSPTAWAALPQVFVNIINGFSDGTNATYSYVPTTQFLHEGEIVTVTGFGNAALNLTSPIKDVFNLVANINGSSITSDVLTVRAPNTFVPGMLVTLQGTAEPFLNGQSLVITAATPITFTASFTHTDYNNPADSGTAEVSTFQIPSSAVVPLQTPGSPTNAGLLTPVLQSGYYFNNGQYVLGTPPINSSTGSGWNPTANIFQGQFIVDSNGNTQLALNSGITGGIQPTWMGAKQAVTPDGTVLWRNIGRNVFNDPTKWVQILNMETNNPTGEVGNWDSLHQYGLLAPRLDQVWEISGGDQDFIFGLY